MYLHYTQKNVFAVLLPNYAALSFFFAWLQLITLIVALSLSQQHSCIFAAKLRSFQLSRTKNRFRTFLLLLRCFQLFCTKTGFLASLELIEWFELYLAQKDVFAVLLLNYTDFPLDKGFLLSSANHVDCTYISLKVTFLLFCC